MEKKIWNLQQGIMSVREYEAKFTRLRTYSSIGINDPTVLARKFEGVLRDLIHGDSNVSDVRNNSLWWKCQRVWRRYFSPGSNRFDGYVLPHIESKWKRETVSR
ncbi:unnamed protein product [Cochlearia groenlandica]